MHRLVGASLLTLAVLAAPTLDVYAQKDKKKDQAKVAGPVDSAKLTSGEFVGILKTVPGSDRMFSVQTETRKLVAPKNGRVNLGGYNNANRAIQLQNQMVQAQQQMARARNIQQRNQAAQRMQNIQLQLQRLIVQINNQGNKGGNNGLPPGYRMETVKQEVEFQAADAVKVRTMVLPEVFDTKGQIKKYTDKELAELKGKDKSLPGYESSMEKLEVGQKIKVVLAPAPAAAKKKEKEDVDKDAIEKDDKRMQVKQIIIMEESSGAPAPKGKDKKKNK